MNEVGVKIEFIFFTLRLVLKGIADTILGLSQHFLGFRYLKNGMARRAILRWSILQIAVLIIASRLND